MGNIVKSYESLLLTTLKKGKIFFTYKGDKDMTAISSYYGKKIKTERLLVISQHTGKVEKITKVTML